MILIDHPFKVGDLVKVGDVEGTVEEVGFRSTRIRTLYNSLVTVPNANVAVAQIDNLGARHYRRTSTHLDLVYGTPKEKVEAFVAGLRQLILDSPKTRKDLYHVYFTDYGASSLRIMFYYFIIAADWGEELAEKHRINLEIMGLAKKVGVEFAFPTQTVFIQNSDPVQPGPLPV
jgi:MscS family membrane protein